MERKRLGKTIFAEPRSDTHLECAKTKMMGFAKSFNPSYALADYPHRSCERPSHDAAAAELYTCFTVWGKFEYLAGDYLTRAGSRQNSPYAFARARNWKMRSTRTAIHQSGNSPNLVPRSAAQAIRLEGSPRATAVQAAIPRVASLRVAGILRG